MWYDNLRRRVDNCPCRRQTSGFASETGAPSKSGFDLLGWETSGAVIVVLNWRPVRTTLAGAKIWNMTDKQVSYTLDSNLDSVNRAEQTAEEVAARAGLGEEDRFKVAMAVREAAVNAVLHGNAYDPQKKMVVSYEDTGEALVVRVSDQGGGLDPTTLPDPLTPENILKQSGRGIFLMRSFMDEVRFRNLAPGTEVTMVKNVQRNPSGKRR